MKYTFAGRTGRAQLTVLESNRRERPVRFQVRLLPRRASWNTSYASAGDQAYLGSDLDMAMIHIRTWTGLDSLEAPGAVRSLLDSDTELPEMVAA